MRRWPFPSAAAAAAVAVAAVKSIYHVVCQLDGSVLSPGARSMPRVFPTSRRNIAAVAADTRIVQPRVMWWWWWSVQWSGVATWTVGTGFILLIPSHACSGQTGYRIAFDNPEDNQGSDVIGMPSAEETNAQHEDAIR